MDKREQLKEILCKSKRVGNHCHDFECKTVTKCIEEILSLFPAPPEKPSAKSVAGSEDILGDYFTKTLEKGELQDMIFKISADKRELQEALSRKDEEMERQKQEFVKILEGLRVKDAYCGCGKEAVVRLRIMHSSEDGKDFVPYCAEHAQEHWQNAEDVNRHEMQQFGGAYGLVDINEIPLVTKDEINKRIDEAIKRLKEGK